MLRGSSRILIEVGKASRPFVDDNDVWVHIVLIKGSFIFSLVILIWLVSSCVFALLLWELGNKCGGSFSAFVFGVAS